MRTGSSPLHPGQLLLHHGQVFEGVTPVLLGFVARPQELDFPLLGLDLVLVFLHLLLGSDLWVSHRLLGEGTQ